MRKESLCCGEIYHILSKSIAGFQIFNNEFDYLRIMNMLQFYRLPKPLLRFSLFNELSISQQEDFLKKNYKLEDLYLVDIIAFCIMPTHIHLILKQLLEKGISNYIKNVFISYTRYFNIKHHRKGPLWEGRFKNVLINNESQLLHVTRYAHLNPVTAGLIDKPEDWLASSYREYIGKINDEGKVCKYDGILNINPTVYQKFVEDRIAYQRQLARIKKLLLD